jgi:Ca2+-binding RTX toxin-like protein
VLTGSDSHEWLRGHAGDDEIKGGVGNDTMKGNRGKDTLHGEEGDDTIAAGRGDDLLNGGAGNDILKGRVGHDTFVFDTELSAAGTDHITDFEPGIDKISLHGSVFAGLGPAGELAEGMFHLGSSAADSDDRIIYDSATGLLKFDPDGIGPEAETTIAKLSTGLALTSADFILA